MNTSQNEKGFGVVGVIIVILVLGGLGAAGWYVYDKQKDKDTAPTSSRSQSVEDKKKQSKTETDTEAQAWHPVTSAQGGFSIRIPDGWKVANYGESNNIRSNDVTYRAGTQATVEEIKNPYAGDSLVRFQVVQYKDSEPVAFLNGDETKTSFTAGEVTGARYYKKHPVEPLLGIGPIPGEETYTYEFKTPGKTTYVMYRILNVNQHSAEYLASNYNQTKSDPNQLELVDRAVRTLEIK